LEKILDARQRLLLQIKVGDVRIDARGGGGFVHQLLKLVLLPPRVLRDQQIARLDAIAVLHRDLVDQSHLVEVVVHAWRRHSNAIDRDLRLALRVGGSAQKQDSGKKRSEERPHVSGVAVHKQIPVYNRERVSPSRPAASVSLILRSYPAGCSPKLAGRLNLSVPNVKQITTTRPIGSEATSS